MNLLTVRVNQFNRIPSAIDIGTNARVLVCHRVDGEPHGRQFVVHVAGSKGAIAGFFVAFFPGENEGVNPHGLSAVYLFGFMCWLFQFISVFLLISQTCSFPIYHDVNPNKSTILTATDEPSPVFNTLITSFERNHNP